MFARIQSHNPFLRWTAAGLIGLASLTGQETLQPEPKPAPPSFELADAPAPQANAPRRWKKVNPSLETRAVNSEGTVAVFLILSRQPQKAIFDRWASQYEPLIESAQDDFERRAKAGRTLSASARQAAQRRNQSILEMRRTAAADVRAAVQVQQEGVVNRLTALGASQFTRFWSINMVGAQIPARALEALDQDPDVVAVEPAEVMRLTLDTSVPAMGTATMWDAGYGGGSQTVAVLDTGIAAAHPAFSGVNLQTAVQLEFAAADECFDDNPSSTEDSHGHGTHVAGTIASRGTSEHPGAVGVASGLGTLISYRVGANTKPVRSCGGSIIHPFDWFLALERLALETPTTVVNMSFGGRTGSEDDMSAWFVDGIADLTGMVVVVAAGNDGGSSSRYQVGSPGNAYNILSVANVNTFRTVETGDDEVAESSSRGPTPLGRNKPDLAAPGSNIYSASHQHAGLAKMTGTSMAAPHVAGAAALMLDSGVRSGREVKALLINSTSTSGWRRDWGWGAVNLASALAQKDNIITAKAQPKRPILWRTFVDGSLRATLVWNRHIAEIDFGRNVAYGKFNDLNLAVYDAARNSLVDVANSKQQNVEQIAIRGRGDAIIRVDSPETTFGYVGTEPFALAYSAGVLEPVAGPKLRIDCDHPKTVQAGSRFQVGCRVQNQGDTPAFSVFTSLALPSGFSTVNSKQAIGDLPVGGSKTVSFEVVTMGQLPAYRTFSAYASSVSFGLEFAGAVELGLNLTEPIPQDCSYELSPANGALTVGPGQQFIDLRIRFPRFRPNDPGACSWEFVKQRATDFFRFIHPRGTPVNQVSGQGDAIIRISTPAAPKGNYQFRSGEVVVKVTRQPNALWVFRQMAP